ncbi:MAG: carboxymuconolactone decarboxylase family protein [Actinomycetota bacterium]|nr:carboxymuconolactone decarboxylase family protein [Actinomycetota bacterium]
MRDTAIGDIVLQRIQDDRGYVLPMHRVFAERDPQFLDGYDRMFTSVMSERSPLSPEVRELLVMALDVAVGTSPKVVGGHAKKAIELGATEEQVVAAIELATIVAAGKVMGAVTSVFDVH